MNPTALINLKKNYLLISRAAGFKIIVYELLRSQGFEYSKGAG